MKQKKMKVYKKPTLLIYNIEPFMVSTLSTEVRDDIVVNSVRNDELELESTNSNKRSSSNVWEDYVEEE